MYKRKGMVQFEETKDVRNGGHFVLRGKERLARSRIILVCVVLLFGAAGFYLKLMHALMCIVSVSYQTIGLFLDVDTCFFPKPMDADVTTYLDNSL
jgi:hypothetical protein